MMKVPRDVQGEEVANHPSSIFLQGQFATKRFVAIWPRQKMIFQRNSRPDDRPRRLLEVAAFRVAMGSVRSVELCGYQALCHKELRGAENRLFIRRFLV